MAKRQRLTNARYKAAGDPYTLNTERKEVDHTPEEYGIRSDFAEGIDNATPWKNEKRDPDTGLPVVSASQIKAMKKRAADAMKLAEILLPGADEDTIDEQTFELMQVPQNILTSTLNRVATLKTAFDDMPPAEQTAPPAEEAPAPLDQAGADDVHSGEDLPPVEEPTEEAPTVEDAKEAVDTIEQVLNDISFDDGAGVGEEPAADPILAALFDRKVTNDQVVAAQQRMLEKQANKKGISSVPNTTTKTAGANPKALLDKLWRRDPDVRDIFQ